MLQGPGHGYDLIERLQQYSISNIDPSLIYRALRVMEDDGLISSAWEEEKTQGPPRRVYTLTREGRDALRFYMDELKLTRERIDQLINVYTNYEAENS